MSQKLLLTKFKGALLKKYTSKCYGSCALHVVQCSLIFIWSIMKISWTVFKLQSGHVFVMDRQTDGRMNRRTNRRTDGRTDDLGKNNMSPNPKEGDIISYNHPTIWRMWLVLLQFNVSKWCKQNGKQCRPWAVWTWSILSAQIRMSENICHRDFILRISVISPTFLVLMDLPLFKIQNSKQKDRRNIDFHSRTFINL